LNKIFQKFKLKQNDFSQKNAGFFLSDRFMPEQLRCHWFYFQGRSMGGSYWYRNSCCPDFMAYKQIE